MKLRVLLASVFCLAAVLIALGGGGLLLGLSKAQAQPGPGPTAVTASSPSSGSSGPEVVPLVGPVCMSTDLRDLPYIPPAPKTLKRILSPYPHPENRRPLRSQTSGLVAIESLIEEVWRPIPTMPSPLLTFAGMNAAQVGVMVPPPDTNGDVGPNHYIQAVNRSFKIFDKNGNTLSGPTTFDSFFAPLKGTPCGGNENEGDPFVFYDQLADRWVITDFASPDSAPFYECIGVSQTGDPVAGGWCLYALQADPANPMHFGDYPKFGLWNNPQPGGAYYFTVNLILYPAQTLDGVRAFALDRGSMLTGGVANAIAFTITPETLGDALSLVPASFRTGTAPPAGEDEFLLAVDLTEDVMLTQVKGWLFHVDFVTPSNSTLGVGANHAPNALITVNGFLNAPHTAVPQRGTTQKLDTLGDRIMTPVVYQNRSGTESLWAAQTVYLTADGPTGIRWYQFVVTRGNFPATPVQQQNWSNGNDRLWRWVPSIAVDANGNMAIGYSVSSPSIFPGIRYAGRLATDAPNNLGQGEAVMTNGGGDQTSTTRWGDYTMTTIDPSDGLSFWHTNEYYPRPSPNTWDTRVGKFQFPAVAPRPTPTVEPRPTPAPRP